MYVSLISCLNLHTNAAAHSHLPARSCVCEQSNGKIHLNADHFRDVF